MGNGTPILGGGTIINNTQRTFNTYTSQHDSRGNYTQVNSIFGRQRTPGNRDDDMLRVGQGGGTFHPNQFGRGVHVNEGDFIKIPDGMGIVISEDRNGVHYGFRGAAPDNGSYGVFRNYRDTGMPPLR